MNKYNIQNYLLDGKSELFRIYYDKYETTFEEFIYLEQISRIQAIENNYKPFIAFKSENIDIFTISKN